MRLFHIDKPGCHHMMDKIVGIKAVYQLEAEFEPYLTVEFLPNTDDKDPGGVILQVGNEVIRRNYLFDDPNDLVQLRALIWEKVRKYHNPVDITGGKDCCMDKFNWYPTFKVVQGWQNKRRLLEGDRCCRDTGHYMRERDPATQRVRGEVYKLDTSSSMDLNSCKKVRTQECWANYPPKGQNMAMCLQLVNPMCNAAYPTNKDRAKVAEQRGKLREQIKRYLQLNGNRSDRKHLDRMFDEWFFQDVSPRGGNNFSVNNKY